MCSLAKKLSFSPEPMEETTKTFNKKIHRRLAFDSATSTLTSALDSDEESRDSGIGSDDEISRIFNGSPMHCQKRPREDDYVNVDISKKMKTMNCEDNTNLSSLDSEKIISALNDADVEKENQIGDFSGPYCLPTITGKHNDLKSITPHTLKRLINQDCADEVAHYAIIDCRYPYEFKGGHIEEATNLYTRNDITTQLLTSKPQSATGKRTIIVFHCEFSSQRGPTLARYLRQKDREINKNRYPALRFPEIYLLDGGYKVFYESFPEHCRPKAYVPMMHSEHSKDLKHFRVKSKSWPRERMTMSKCLRI